MSRADSDPDHRHGPIRWAWRPHRRGEPAEHLARDWLAPWTGVAGDERPLPRNAHGRPMIASRDGRHDASWSHSGDILLIAVGEDVDVGVDVELLKPRRRALELAARYFTADETAWLAALAAPARDEAFVRLWCAKEAVLKAHGRGLAFGLHRLAFVEHDGVLTLAATAPQLGVPEAWTVHEFAPLSGYRAALAWRPRGVGDTGGA